MRNKIIEYSYRIVDMGCGCCQEGQSQYSVWEDGVPTVADEDCPIMSDEQDLRDYLSHLEPFDIDKDCEFF
jgi:hypothetical protein